MQAKITGIDEVIKTLRNLPGATQRKVIMPSLRKGGNVVKKLAVSNIKSLVSNEATGTAARSISVYNLKKKGGNYRVGVQIKKGAVNSQKLVNGKPVRVGLYMAVFEYGKKNQSPRSWIRKAAREGVVPATNAVRQEFSKRIDLAVKDARK